jgi:hypothetical protein
MRLEPTDTSADRFGIGGHTGLTQDVDNKAGAVAGSVFGVGCAVAALKPT